MPFDGKTLDVVATTDRARFAADLAKHANEPYGFRASPFHCALARFFREPHCFQGGWRADFMTRYDTMRRQPTGFDCLCILNSIP